MCLQVQFGQTEKTRIILGEQMISGYFKVQPTVQSSNISDKGQKNATRSQIEGREKGNIIYRHNRQTPKQIFTGVSHQRGLKRFVSTKAIRKYEKIRRSNEKHKKNY
jgi:hypothetical protein